MRFLADECCDGSLVRALRQSGHDVAYVTESMPGATDPEVLQRAMYSHLQPEVMHRVMRETFEADN